MASSSLPGSALFIPTPTKKTRPKSRSFCPSMSNRNTPNPNLITAVGRLLWGQSLPPQLLISAVRASWSTAWQLMMSQLAPSDSGGRYTRPASQFRADSGFRQKPGALHLYVGLPCPWAHRTLIVRALKGLEHAVPISIASPGPDGSWEFREGHVQLTDRLVPGLDGANGCKTLREIYKLRRGGYDGRSTVPMLWDVEKKEVVCNESYDIAELFNSGLNGLASNPSLDLSPPPLKKQIDHWNQIVYPSVNNGVYRCGFAQSQEAYDAAANELFRTMDMLDDHLGRSRYLCGDVLTLADVCLFTTLIRFDLVYNVLFKCTKKKLLEYPNLHSYTRDIYQIPKVAETCNFEAIMDGYYKVLFPLNPGGILPVLPLGCGHEWLSEPHNRGSLTLVGKDVEVHVS
ncbi:uncharacterized protein LOC127814245 [Diospyros lotus]|uniref:uncharacterized protein LOC127814245 n=1 Tax=Diospyros lotus TaxID=55363 RepID=UPI002250B2E8|nr:uncharacterized protein LOC127814245 [Diospyros lotus]